MALWVSHGLGGALLLGVVVLQHSWLPTGWAISAQAGRFPPPAVGLAAALSPVQPSALVKPRLLWRFDPSRFRQLK